MTEQPAPIPNQGSSIWQLVLRDMYQREQVGIMRYGTPLQALDLVVYLRQAIEERHALTQNSPAIKPEI